jgi:hypothetical protein
MAEVTADNWNSTLAALQQAYQESEAFSKWAPPAGEFDCFISNIKKGMAKKSTPTDPQPYWIVQAEIMNGMDEEGNDLTGKTFDYAIFMRNSFGKMKEFASRIAGCTISNISEADNIISGAQGNISLRILVSKTPKQDGSGEWTNFKILDIHPLESAPEEGPADAA